MFATAEDIDNDDVVDCIYTGRTARGINNRSTAYTGSDFNTEHLWPQSLGATGAAQSDIHHLWASDEIVNSRRSNNAFGEVATVSWTAPDADGTGPSRLGKSSSGRTVFEPHARTKGDVARAIFYFYTRYAAPSAPRPSKLSLTNFAVEEATLRRWHAADPPDAEERGHNDAVYTIQGNRNPYIDHPEWVAALPDFP
jgi:deoxyribonuclease I